MSFRWEGLTADLAAHGVTATIADRSTHPDTPDLLPDAKSITIHENGWRIEVNDTWSSEAPDANWRGWIVHLIDPIGTVRDRADHLYAPTDVVRAVLDALDIARRSA